MKKKFFSKLLTLGLAASMLIGNQAMVLASESSDTSFTAKDGMIDEQEGDVFVLSVIPTEIPSEILKELKNRFHIWLIWALPESG